MLKIELDQKTAGYQPGEKISGRVYWDLEDEPDAINVRLFWYTKGAGDRDVSIVCEDVYLKPGMKGDDRFHFKCPDGPHSFSGSTISLRWAMELIARPNDEIERVKLTVSDSGSQIDLQSISILEN